MKGMVLAAGYGTRFRPATYEVPKPLVPLCNRALIDYAIDSLLAAGTSDVVVNLHHLAGPLRKHLDREYSGRCTIHYSHEDEILGTGGGIRRVRALFEDDDSFFVVNGDTVQFPPLVQLEKSRVEHGAVAALLLRHPPEGDRFTEVWYERGRVTGFGTGRGEALMFSGAHALSSRIFELLPDREFSGITEDVYIPLLHDGKGILAGFVHDGPWFDIGTPLRYLQASHAVRALMLDGTVALPNGSVGIRERSSIVAEGTMIEAGEECVAGEGTAIASEADVRRSVFWRGCKVAAGAVVRDSVVCNEVELRAGERVENALVCRVRPDFSYDEGTICIGGLAAVAVDPNRKIIVEAA